MKKLITFLFCTFLFVNIQAQTIGLNIGDQVPTLNYWNQDSTAQIALSSLQGKLYWLIFGHRGAGLAEEKVPTKCILITPIRTPNFARYKAKGFILNQYQLVLNNQFFNYFFFGGGICNVYKIHSISNI
ncbi:MAG: hypothetical protein ABI388_04305, partial [Bacteroidia bacterium]